MSCSLQSITMASRFGQAASQQGVEPTLEYADTGPRRDILGDLTDAVGSEASAWAIYYSLYEWYNPLWKADPKRYAIEHMHPQFKDLVTR